MMEQNWFKLVYHPMGDGAGKRFSFVFEFQNFLTEPVDELPIMGGVFHFVRLNFVWTNWTAKEMEGFYFPPDQQLWSQKIKIAL